MMAGAVSSSAPLSVATVTLPFPARRAAPITTSPPRRTDHLLTARECAARDSAFADLGRDDIPSPLTTHNPAPRKFAPVKNTVKAKL